MYLTRFLRNNFKLKQDVHTGFVLIKGHIYSMIDLIDSIKSKNLSTGTTHTPALARVTLGINDYTHQN